MTDDDVQATATLLKKLQPGFLPYLIFEQIARLVALPIVEFIPLRWRDGRVEVLLIPREADDPYWPGMLHTPGTVIRATDVPRDEHENWPAFHRILHEELQDTEVGPPHYVGSMFHKGRRGAEQAQLYWVEVLAEPQVGQFYVVDELPQNVIESQLSFINEAMRHFQHYNRPE